MDKIKRWWIAANFRLSLIVFWFFLVVSSLYGQTIIQGEIDSSLEIDSFTITYTTNFVEHENIFSRGRNIPVEVNEGKFSVQLNESPNVFYIKLNLPKSRAESTGDDYKSLGNNGNAFMIKPNSAVVINVLPAKISFSGTQRLLMECQLELFNLYTAMRKERIQLSNVHSSQQTSSLGGKISTYLDAYKGVHDSTIHVAKNIVATYHLDSLTQNSVYYNFMGMIRFFEINYLNLKAAFSNDSLRARYVDYYNANYSDKKTDSEAWNYLGQSNMYPKYLAYKIRTDIAMRLAPLSRDIKPSLLLVDNLIADRYQDDLYDQVAFSSLLLRGTREYIDEMFFTRVLGNIRNKEYRAYIQEMRNRRSAGQPSYQFHLEDESGKIYRNKDFKGKVILLDFWFTGCKGCLALHQNMKPVKEYFKDNKFFIYVSVSIDKNKEMWKKSLASGDYTDETDIKLWLGDLGKKHPIVEFYDIASYPTMILIDGNDEVVAMNPPNPYSAHNKNALINMINEAMKK